ncbi:MULTISPECIES: cbb3-type cytochrome oxidase assembly protein CcoS [unclassified Lentimicrobium]|uniref:cbb3-type cytochrome oxidase assembly protein CcoS n=1 Tax=unclassified Lentimicrobium TaxID=2677434 RepID=UPI001556EFE5|nr:MULTISPECIES: cbb3-type cytochrome oxidase assembly protein CcoS [unclassified Lentimicrobium]NPD47634.1 cbb3-type cytochrome oxidase assembly protein CcoS [Lentimicrobium sp. S6]NPD86510.1 cbb3-type cytochrome oxidase assembly protein CcoS [Lentimicrobium sp. L6]
MTILFVLITVSSFVAGIFLIAFIWAVKSGQFDDSYTPSVRALFDDDVVPENSTPEIKDSSNNENE